MTDFWEDHPRWIRNALGGHVGWYWLVHFTFAYIIYAGVFPAVNAIMGLPWPGGLGGFIAFGLSIFVLITILYVLFYLPVRVCGNDNLMGYLCAISSFALPWFFLQ